MRLRDKLKYISLFVSQWKGYLRKMRGYPTSILYADTEKLENYKISGIGIKDNKNIMQYPPEFLNRENSKVINGITWVLNDDGSVTANGTATANSIYYYTTFRTDNNQIRFQNRYNYIDAEKSYIISGCPENGSTSAYYTYVYFADTDLKSFQYFQDTGNGAVIRIPPKLSYKINQFAIALCIVNGFTAENITFKPQLEEYPHDATTSTPTEYETYIPSPEKPMPIKTLGIKSPNLLPLRVVALGTTQQEILTTKHEGLDDIGEINGITYKVDRDAGTIHISGTTTDKDARIFIGYTYNTIYNYDEYPKLKKDTYYKFDIVPTNDLGVYDTILCGICGDGWKALSIDDTKTIITMGSIENLSIGDKIIYSDQSINVSTNDFSKYYTITSIDTTAKTITVDATIEASFPRYIFIKDKLINPDAPIQNVYAAWKSHSSLSGKLIDNIMNGYPYLQRVCISIPKGKTVDMICKPSIKEVKMTDDYNMISKWSKVMNNSIKALVGRGVTVWYDESDDTITLNGTATDSNGCIYLDVFRYEDEILSSSDEYLFSWKKISGSATPVDDTKTSTAYIAPIYYSNADKSNYNAFNLFSLLNSDGETATITASKGICGFAIADPNHVVFDNLKIKIVLIKKNEEYEKYGNYKINVVHRSKNIFDANLLNQLTKTYFSYDDDKKEITVKYSGNSVGYTCTECTLKHFCPDLNPGDYIKVRGTVTQGSTNVCRQIYLTGSQRYLFFGNAQVRITQADLDSRVSFYGVNTSLGDEKGDVIISNFMIIKDNWDSGLHSTQNYDDTYEDYNRNIYTINIPEPMAKIKFIEDYIDFKTKTFHKNIQKITFPINIKDEFYTTNTVSTYSNGGATKYGYVIKFPNKKFNDSSTYFMSMHDKFPGYGRPNRDNTVSIFWPYGCKLEGIYVKQEKTESSTLKENAIVGKAVVGKATPYSIQHDLLVYINTNTIATVDELKKTLAGTTLYFETDSTYEEVSNIDLPDITLYKGTNIFKIDDTSASMEVEYHPTSSYKKIF